MRKVIYSALLLFILTYSTATAQTTFKTAIEYNDFIVGEQFKTLKLLTKFNDLMIPDSLDKARTLLTGEMKTTAREAIAKVKRMPAFNGDTQLRDAAAALFSFYYNCFGAEYPEMINIIAKGNNLNEADISRIDVLIKNITETEKGFDDAFKTAQTNFAQKNGFTLSK